MAGHHLKTTATKLLATQKLIKVIRKTAKELDPIWPLFTAKKRMISWQLWLRDPIPDTIHGLGCKEWATMIPGPLMITQPSVIPTGM